MVALLLAALAMAGCPESAAHCIGDGWTALMERGPEGLADGTALFAQACDAGEPAGCLFEAAALQTALPPEEWGPRADLKAPCRQLGWPICTRILEDEGAARLGVSWEQVAEIINQEVFPAVVADTGIDSQRPVELVLERKPWLFQMWPDARRNAIYAEVRFEPLGEQVQASHATQDQHLGGLGAVAAPV